ncbi:MAG: Eco57I restriction-modification methylase domain-containing protein [Ignavibacteriaceae bacterium]|nr:Eco57I restriction-modification methylase domain-containing protein [Ignavibacteriaceae bacterium]
MIYTSRSNGKEHGSVMTNHEIVEFMLDVVHYTPCKDLSKVTILEPSAGFGAFVLPVLERLFLSSINFNFPFEVALSNVLVVDIDSKKIKFLRNKIFEFLVNKAVKNAQYYAANIVQEHDFLLSEFPAFDIIIGNPPYIRHELIPEEKKQYYRKHFTTFRHRSDLYIAFFEKALSLLPKHGKVNFICSNRWMKNKYGEQLRKLLNSSYHISLIVEIDCDEVFDEKVTAYPAITLIENKNSTGFFEGKIEKLSQLSQLKKSFHLGNDKECKFLFSGQILNSNFSTIEEQCFKIGIGSATGADNIFIRCIKDFGNIEKDVLIPMVKSENIIDGKIIDVDQALLNPDGLFSQCFINSNHYPNAEKYLEANREKLSNRYIAKKNPEKWYKTIDKIDPLLTKRPKILIPDIKKNGSSIVLDCGNYYPHHNIYFITHCANEIIPLQVLGAFLLSDNIYKQMQNNSVLMRGGYFRWQAQNLRKLKIPKLSLLTNNQKVILASSFLKRDMGAINQIVSDIFQKLEGTTEKLSSSKISSNLINYDFTSSKNHISQKMKTKNQTTKKSKLKIDLFPAGSSG